MKSNWYIKVVDALVEVEQKYDLYNYRHNGLEVWGEIRRAILFSHANKRAKKENINSSNESSKYIDDFPLSKLKSADVLIFEHHRKINVDGEYIDPVTCNLDMHFQEGTEIVRVERQSFANHVFKPFNEKYVNSFELAALPLEYRKAVKGVGDIEELYRFVAEVDKIIGGESLSRKDVKRLLAKFIQEFSYYRYCFEQCKPKMIILPMYYVKPVIVLAANRLGIETVDIQYAAINNHHIGYYYPGAKDIAYFPRKMLVWSSAWKKEYIPIESAQFYLTRNRIVDYKDKFEKKISATYFSQDMLGQGFFEDYVLNYNRNNNMVYKPHPWEDYGENTGYKIINRKDFVDQLRLIAESNLVVTSFSTSIYEALYLGCNICLIDDDNKYLVDEYRSFNLKKLGTIIDYGSLFEVDGSVYYGSEFEMMTLNDVEINMDTKIDFNANRFYYRVRNILKFPKKVYEKLIIIIK